MIGLGVRELARGGIWATIIFAGLGTVAALWENPLFLRMTPTGGFEIAALAVQSSLMGAYLAIPGNACAGKRMGAGAAIGFLGLACPICNKILLLAFSASALMNYLEPARPALAAGGVVIVAAALAVKIANRRAVMERPTRA
jgi:hypothetical protein